MHLEDPILTRFVDGESPPDEVRRVESHLDACEVCQARMTDLRDWDDRVSELLTRVDGRTPEPDLQAVIMAASRTRRGPRLRWAAGIVISTGVAAAAWAAPGSPVPGWVDGLRSRTTGAVVSPGMGDAAQDPASGGSGGIGVVPGRDFTVVIDAAASGLRMVVALGEAPTLMVQAEEGAATFRSDPDRLVVEASGAGLLTLTVPRGAARVRILVDSLPVWSKEADRVMVTTGARATGPERWEIGPPSGG